MKLLDTSANQVRLPSTSVLMVYNTASQDGLTIAKYYQQARNIPDANLLAVTCSADRGTHFGYSDFVSSLLTPIQNKITALGGLWSPTNNSGIRFVVLCSGICPYANFDDAKTQPVGTQWLLMARCHGLTGGTSTAFVAQAWNAARAGLDYPLVSHLDAMPKPFNGNGAHQGVYSLAAVKRIIDLSCSAKPFDTPVLIQHALGNINTTDYTSTNAQNVADCLARNAPVIYGRESLYTQGRSLAGMQNAGAYQGQAQAGSHYRPDLLTFMPGAIVECTNSYGCLGNARSNGEFYAHLSMQDFIAANATCGVGNVEEAGVDFADWGVLWPRYRSGFTAAEAIWAASLLAGQFARFWMVLGDPLCAPYAAN